VRHSRRVTTLAAPLDALGQRLALRKRRGNQHRFTTELHGDAKAYNF